MPLRIAIVGCGKAAENHALAIKSQRNVSIVAACDSEPLMAEQFCARHGVEAGYQNLIPLLKEQDPDVVHITTPPQSHLSLALAAIEAGCHVLVEKPLAESAAGAAQIIRAAERCHRKLTIGWIYYFDPVVQQMRDSINRGSIGTAVQVHALQSYDLEGSFGKAVLAQTDHWVHRLKGKLIRNNLDHLLSLVVGFLPEDSSIIDVHAWRAAESPYPDLLDELRVTLGSRETLVQITFSCRARPIGHFLTVEGSKSRVRLDLANQTFVVESASHLPGPLGRLAFGLRQVHQGAKNLVQNSTRLVRTDGFGLPGLRRLVAAFYRSIEGDHDVPIPYEHILSVSDLVDQVIARSDLPQTVMQ